MDWKIKYIVGKLVAKYPFVKAYMDIVDKTYLVNFEVDNTQLDENHPYHADRLETCNFISMYNDTLVLFTTNEELFKLTENKVEIEPFVIDKHTPMKEKIKIIANLIDTICSEYGVSDVCLENIYHPVSFNGDGTPVVIPQCRVNRKKSSYNGNDIIEIHYRYYDEEWRGTHLSERDNSHYAEMSADSIIDALYLAQFKYDNQHNLFINIKNKIGDNINDRLIFAQLFNDNF